MATESSGWWSDTNSVCGHSSSYFHSQHDAPLSYPNDNCYFYHPNYCHSAAGIGSVEDNNSNCSSPLSSTLPVSPCYDINNEMHQDVSTTAGCSNNGGIADGSSSNNNNNRPTTPTFNSAGSASSKSRSSAVSKTTGGEGGGGGTRGGCASQLVLPPCRVCGEKASGFHYGVNSCEACKGFFRRSMYKTERYRCLGNGKCEVASSRRGSCSACRLDKCIAIGMSKRAIKTGRYTHEKRAKDIAEVKRLEQLRRSSGRDVTVLSTVPSNHAFEEIIQRITYAHMQHAQGALDLMTERENEYLEQKALKESLFGRLKPLPVDEYMKIYETTGMDVDDRRVLLESILPFLETRIKDFILFAKAIPGFSEFLIEDQISVIKSSRFEAWMILNHKMFNQEKRLYTTVFGKTICEEVMLMIHSASYIENLFLINQRIRSLKLDYDEMCILAALVMMSADRCVLQDRKRVEESQSLMLTCLQYLFAKLRPDEPLVFARVVAVLMELRNTHQLHESEDQVIAANWFDKIHIPPLVYEMWSS